MSKERDWFPVFPEIEDLFRRAKGDEHIYFMDSFFEYAAGHYKNANKLKRKCRRCLWKGIDHYWFLMDQCFEERDDYAEQNH